jgi:hypothetical protein
MRPREVLRGREWRKRVGVEPTKNRLTALSGFEGQPPHRERFPSIVDNCPEPARCHRSAAAD